MCHEESQQIGLQTFQHSLKQRKWMNRYQTEKQNYRTGECDIGDTCYETKDKDQANDKESHHGDLSASQRCT